MLRKLIKAGVAAGMVGGGLFITDQIYWRGIHPRLPDRFVNAVAASRGRLITYQYGIQGFGLIVVLPLAAKLLGLSSRSPLKPGAAAV